MSAIEGLVAQAMIGNGAALVLHGDAGMGKSALLDHAADLAGAGSGALVLRATGVESEGISPSPRSTSSCTP